MKTFESLRDAKRLAKAMVKDHTAKLEIHKAGLKALEVSIREEKPSRSREYYVLVKAVNHSLSSIFAHKNLLAMSHQQLFDTSKELTFFCNKK